MRKNRIEKLQSELGENQEYNLESRFIFHPYLGYIGRPPSLSSDGKSKHSYNQFGMTSSQKHPYPYKKQANELVVAVVGGSVAEIFASGMEIRVNNYMRKLGFTRKIILINLAIGGYKQPQQLFHLQYALLSGFHIDAVLNIDGFNDLALANNNIELNVNPIYPSAHSIGSLLQMQSQPVLSRSLVDFSSKYYNLYDSEYNYLSLLQTSPFRFSSFLSLTGELLSNNYNSKRESLKVKWTVKSAGSFPDIFRGPKLPMGENNLDKVTDIWKEASKMLFAICKEYGLQYIQILQPNQYVINSKPLTEKELKIAVSPKSEWGQCAKDGYKYLINKGKELKKAGVPFYDFHMIFKDTKETLYIDSCCHFNYSGNIIMAKEISRILYGQLTESKK
ncbi:MAG: hypothetical protein GY705_16805 [Bacteroidetes bacterium]|nr:hypothetical protein [Bacteroidota bacterium]